MYASPFIDESFDINNCHNYILSIQCALDGFSFSIYDTQTKRFIVFNEYNINALSAFELKGEISGLIEKESILQQKYKLVKVCYLSQQTTTIPGSLFLSADIETYFESCFERDRNTNVLKSDLPHGIINLFGIPKLIEDFFNDTFPGCKYFGPLTSVLNHASHLTQHKKRLLVYKHKHHLFCAIVEGNHLLFQNTFFVKNDTDCGYYILNALKQLKCDSDTETILYGKIKPKSELQTILKRYLNEVIPARFNSQYSVSYSFYKEPENYHITTLELALCE